jgi:HPr kinase/phosphorylase
MDNAHNSPLQGAHSTHNSVAHHGIAMEIFKRGIILIGKSGIGKSELGLELVDRGHRLICDDLVSGQLIKNEVVIRAPQSFGIGFMEIRGIGFVDIPRLYGHNTICNAQKLFLIIELVENSILDLTNSDRLLQLITQVKVLGITVPLYKLPIGANRNLPILVELIVKYAIECSQGYDSHQAFIKQQLDYLQREP